MKQNSKGFTLGELLIVVAIIAVLVSVGIPVFSSQLEKSRRAVDLSNARNIKAALMYAYADGTIEFPYAYDSDNGVNTYIAVLVNKDGPVYRASGSVKVNGNDWHTDKANGGDYARVRLLIEKVGFGNVKVHAKNTANSGWASYAIVLFSDGTCRMFSSTEKMDPGASTRGAFESYLEDLLTAKETGMEQAAE